ncbi:tyrosine-protein phosphatase [Flagellimonas okinawensis]|uniref:protein-tyrosine-phosphatase n=1 Tax=Flagellimonas okinawensis TaxID=3031324 RepID=A0ABT5XR32_9FLAO|nr:CpsB/CapC family capsule biosynthesis tyrosine phosphatase [[Muricauda] okinawensis]MDF0708346.1 histidinol phosphatase [[Muricauda] okinawensis]
MISFFQKKVYLADYLHGLVDIHNHILPGIDDGAKTVEDSLELIRTFSEMGVTNFRCTPHIMHNHYDNTPKTIKNSYDQLLEGIKKKDLSDIKIDYAAEHMIDDNFENILQEKQVMPLGSDYLLIEMSYLQPSFNFDISVEEIARHGYFPILAHPERYMYYHGSYGKYPSMKSKGILFQLNLLSLSSESYGAAAQKMAEKLLKNDLIDFVGSDIHNIRQLELLKEIKLSKKVLTKLLPIIERTIQTFY